MKRLLRGIVAVLAVIFLLLAATYVYMRLSLPQTAGTIVLPGLRAVVEIVRDRYGIPHIFAQNNADANFALGFVHAQDRLWQMEVNRRIAAGRLSEVVGPRALPSDKFLRTLGIARHAAATFEHLDDEARAALSAYAAGVNAYLAQRSGPWPPEFMLFRVTPELWTAVDSLSWVKMMAWDLGGNWREELLRARLAKKLSTEQLDEFLSPSRERFAHVEIGTSPTDAPDAAPSEAPKATPESSSDSSPDSSSNASRPAAGRSPSASPDNAPNSPATEAPDATRNGTVDAPPSGAADSALAAPTLVPPDSTPDAVPSSPSSPPDAPSGDGSAAPSRAPDSSPGEGAGADQPDSAPSGPAVPAIPDEPAAAPNPSNADDLRALYGVLADHFAQLASLAPPTLAEGAGSNNWAVAGRFSVSGKPLLANDPHLALTAPSLWYFAHLYTPGSNVIGATLPGVPAVVLGRNDRIAWGFTNTGPDVQDLYLEKIDVGDPRRYATPDGSREFAVRTEIIKVKGEPDLTLTVRESRHGPIISDLVAAPIETGHVLAFAWTTLADDDLSFQASLKLARAGNWNEFVNAVRDFDSPQQNMVYADVDGNIGFIAPGRVPLRKPDNDLQGRAPAPGWDARYDWDGVIPFDALPRSFNPAGGKIVTANNRIVGDDYPYFITHEWAAPYRVRRIAELLGARERHDSASFAAIQGDIASPMIAEFLPLLRKVRPLNAEAAAALQLLTGWNGEMTADQPQPLIAAAWLRELSRLIYADELGELFDAAWEQRPLFLFNVLTDKDGQGRWCDDITTPAREDCAQQIAAALSLALADLRQRYGANMLRWRWGAAHAAHAEHRPFSQHAVLSRLFDLQIPTGGDTYSIDVGRYTISDAAAPYANRHAATLRAIYDLADLDRSLFIHSSGQSGNQLSPLYSDFIEPWARVEYLPMTTRRADIDDGAIGTLRLAPAP